MFNVQRGQGTMTPPSSSILPLLYKAKIIFLKWFNFFYICFPRASEMCFYGFRKSYNANFSSGANHGGAYNKHLR